MKKKIGSILVLVAMLMQLFSFSVSASPCCYVSISTIMEEDNMVTFTLDYNTVFTPRDIGVTVSLDHGNHTYSQVTSTSVTVNDAEGTVDVSFDESYFLTGKTYHISPGWIGHCEWDACGDESKSFTPATGLDLIDYDGRDLTLVGGGKMALRFQTGAAGYYDFSVQESEGYVHVNKYGRYGAVEGIAYYEANEEILCIAENSTDIDAVFKINFGPAEIKEEESLITGKPQNGDKLFSIPSKSGIKQIEIPVTGVYNMKRSAAQWYGSYTIMQGEDRVCTVYEDTQHLMEAGTYHVNTTEAGAISGEDEVPDSLDIYYVVPETITFGEPHILKNNAEPVYYTFTLDAPAELSLVSEENNVYGELRNFKYDVRRTVSQGGVYPAGEYFISVIANSDAEEISFTMNQTALESVETDVASSPTYTDTNGELCYAFQAPERAEYLFDFTQSASVGRNKYFYLYQGYYGDHVYISMEQGEWVNIRVEEGTILTVSKVVEPVYQPLTMNTEAEYDYVCGKRNYFSYTAEKADSYKLIMDGFYDVKIVISGETIFEGDSNDMKAFDLAEGETVYIQTIGRGIPSVPGTETIKLVGSVQDIQNGESFDLYNDTETEVRLAVEDSGLYEIVVRKNGYSAYMGFYFNNSYNYLGSYTRTVTIVANLQAGAKNTFRFTKCGSGYGCTATVTATKVETTEIAADTTLSVTAGTYYKFQPEASGVYAVVGTIDGVIQENILKSIITSDNSYPCLSYDENSIAIGATAGQEYILTFRSNCDVVLSALETEEIQIGQTYVTDDQMRIFAFSTDTEGYYRIANELSNTSYSILCNGYWELISGTYCNLFYLDAGTHYIAVVPKNYADGSKPKGSFRIETSESEKDLSISIDDCYFLPGDGPTVGFAITAPEGQAVGFGFEYQAADGTTVQQTCGYEAMHCGDKRYHKSNYISCLELGKTYTLKPFIYPDIEKESVGSGDGVPENAVLTYGEEKTVTVEMTAELISLTNKTTPVKFAVHDAYHYHMKYHYFTFLQPENGDVSIVFPDYVSYYSVYDENYKYVSRNNGYYTLEANKRYYISAGVYGDGLSNVEISSLPEGGAYGICDAKVDMENNCVSFSVSGGTVPGSAVYVALYDSNKKLIEIKSVSATADEQTVPFTNLQNASSCKLMYILTSTMHPLCNEEEISIGA